ncbi:hypothetical protein [Domibacillus iocasae]|nr:hypothetical protein [Domibacillus iocasae]
MKSVEVLILATMAFTASAVFRSSSLAIGIGMTISFSLIRLLICFLVFHLFTFTVFVKRDVAE